MENKVYHKNFVRLVGVYTYCRMMHGVYNVKLYSYLSDIYQAYTKVQKNNKQNDFSQNRLVIQEF